MRYWPGKLVHRKLTSPRKSTSSLQRQRQWVERRCATIYHPPVLPTPRPVTPVMEILVNHPLTREANNHDEIDKFHHEQVQDRSLYARRTIRTSDTDRNSESIRTWDRSSSANVYTARSSTEQLPKYCWFGTFERFETHEVRDGGSCETYQRSNGSKRSQDLRTKRHQHISPLMGSDVAATQKAAEIPKTFEELLQWISSASPSVGIFIPKAAFRPSSLDSLGRFWAV